MIDDDAFAHHALYFRNALVRANYNNIPRNIYKTDEHLIRFLSNLLLGTSHRCSNRALHVERSEELQKDQQLLEGIYKLNQESKSFRFLAEEENLYSEADFKIRYID
jgi:hypothetical protein